MMANEWEMNVYKVCEMSEFSMAYADQPKKSW